MSNWKISEELTDDKHIVIDTGQKRGCILLERHIEGCDSEDMLNARIIAAAPQMLDALKTIIPFIENESAKTIALLAKMKAEGKI